MKKKKQINAVIKKKIILKYKLRMLEQNDQSTSNQCSEHQFTIRQQIQNSVQVNMGQSTIILGSNSEKTDKERQNLVQAPSQNKNNRHLGENENKIVQKEEKDNEIQENNQHTNSKNMDQLEEYIQTNQQRKQQNKEIQHNQQQLLNNYPCQSRNIILQPRNNTFLKEIYQKQSQKLQNLNNLELKSAQIQSHMRKQIYIQKEKISKISQVQSQLNHQIKFIQSIDIIKETNDKVQKDQKLLLNRTQSMMCIENNLQQWQETPEQSYQSHESIYFLPINIITTDVNELVQNYQFGPQRIRIQKQLIDPAQINIFMKEEEELQIKPSFENNRINHQQISCLNANQNQSFSKKIEQIISVLIQKFPNYNILDVVQAIKKKILSSTNFAQQLSKNISNNNNQEQQQEAENQNEQSDEGNMDQVDENMDNNNLSKNKDKLETIVAAIYAVKGYGYTHTHLILSEQYSYDISDYQYRKIMYKICWVTFKGLETLLANQIEFADRIKVKQLAQRLVRAEKWLRHTYQHYVTLLKQIYKLQENSISKQQGLALYKQIQLKFIEPMFGTSTPTQRKTQHHQTSDQQSINIDQVWNEEYNISLSVLYQKHKLISKVRQELIKLEPKYSKIFVYEEIRKKFAHLLKDILKQIEQKYENYFNCPAFPSTHRKDFISKSTGQFLQIRIELLKFWTKSNYSKAAVMQIVIKMNELLGREQISSIEFGDMDSRRSPRFKNTGKANNTFNNNFQENKIVSRAVALIRNQLKGNKPSNKKLII